MLLILAIPALADGPPEPGCTGFISITGNTNINTFELEYVFDQNLRLSTTEVPGSESRLVSLILPVRSFSGSSSRLEEDFYDLVRARLHPDIVIGFEDLRSAHLHPGAVMKKVRISLAGVTREYEVPCSLEDQKNDILTVSGSRVIPISDFGIDPPERFLGLVQVEDHIFVKFSVNFTSDSISENADTP